MILAIVRWAAVVLMYLYSAFHFIATLNVEEKRFEHVVSAGFMFLAVYIMAKED